MFFPNGRSHLIKIKKRLLGPPEIKIQTRPVSIHITKLKKWAFGWHEAHNLSRAHNILSERRHGKPFTSPKVKWPSTNVKWAYVVLMHHFWAVKAPFP